MKEELGAIDLNVACEKYPKNFRTESWAFIYIYLIYAYISIVAKISIVS